SDLVREGGGLAGEKPVRLPVRPAEWALLGLVLGVAAGAAWPRRGLSALLLLAALGVAFAEPIEDWRAARSAQAVIGQRVTLEGTEFELAAGQVVRVLEREGAHVKVRAARDLDGRIPAGAVLPVDESR
ncbi:MAG TPA: hypothetical protein VMS88_08070, partial [Terriglobales bacterium]|nr:hypothetical protein [Terriglobales bacterium]